MSGKPDRRFRQLIDSKEKGMYHLIDFNVKHREIIRKYPNQIPIDITCVHFGKEKISSTERAAGWHQSMIEAMHQDNGAFEFHSSEIEYWYERQLKSDLAAALKLLAEQ